MREIPDTYCKFQSSCWTLECVPSSRLIAVGFEVMVSKVIFVVDFFALSGTNIQDDNMWQTIVWWLAVNMGWARSVSEFNRPSRWRRESADAWCRSSSCHVVSISCVSGIGRRCVTSARGVIKPRSNQTVSALHSDYACLHATNLTSGTSATQLGDSQNALIISVVILKGLPYKSVSF